MSGLEGALALDAMAAVWAFLVALRCKRLEWCIPLERALTLFAGSRLAAVLMGGYALFIGLHDAYFGWWGLTVAAWGWFAGGMMTSGGIIVLCSALLDRQRNEGC